MRPGIYPDSEALTYLDPPLVWALRRAADGPLRDAALAAARYAARVTGLTNRPEVALALRPDAPVPSAELDKLLAGFLRAARKSAGDPRIGGRYWAVSAVREAANPLPLAAAFRATEAARSAAGAFGLEAGALRQEVLGVLGDPRPPSGSMGLAASPGPLPADKYAWTSAHWLATVGGDHLSPGQRGRCRPCARPRSRRCRRRRTGPVLRSHRRDPGRRRLGGGGGKP